MLKEVLCLFLVGTLFVAAVSARSCETTSDCNTDECCIEYFPTIKSCKDKPNDVGDRCKGQFNCDCKQGLTCQADPPSIYNVVKIGIGSCVRN